MQRFTATSAKPLTLAARKAELARLVKSGKITEAQARLIDLREPTAKERAQAEALLPSARAILARRRGKAA